MTAGTYAVIATDANGCTISSSTTISEPTVLSLSLTVGSNVSCNGGNDGSATATISGGTAGYSFLWDAAAGSQTSATASNLTAGTYFVTVTDANACSIVDNITITEPIVLTANISLGNNVSCNGGNDGAATVLVNGGTPDGSGDYQYLWSASTGFQTTATATSLSAGLHTVTVTDDNNCNTTAAIAITEPPVLQLNVLVNANVSCNGGSDASATAMPSDGTPAYAYL